MKFVVNIIFITKHTQSITFTYVILSALFNRKLMICDPKSTCFKGKLIPKNFEVISVSKVSLKSLQSNDVDEFSSEECQTSITK